MAELEKILIEKIKSIRAIYVSSYIPRKCGIATFTKDLTNAINLLNPHALAEVMAIIRPEESIQYPWEVKFKILQDDLNTYLNAIDYIKQSSTDIVILEHEFGLFGGRYGEYIVPFCEKIDKPFVVTFHTVLDDPNSESAFLLKRLADKATAITVMMENIRKKLIDEYAISSNKIVTIPHGTPDLPYSPTTSFKKKRRLSDRIIMGNINLLTPGRGIEHALEAVSFVAKKYPNILYLIIGQTHPVYLKEHGESYRNSLKKLVRKLKISKNVRFVNQYVTLEQLTDWLKTMDFYITSYLDPQQVSSGALAYAIGAGKCCLSTPYVYAKETLANNRGVMVPFRDAEAIASKIIELWENPEKKTEIEKNAYNYGRLMTWSNVAMRHLNLFNMILKNKNGENSGPINLKA